MITTYLAGEDRQRDNWYKVFLDSVHVGYIYQIGQGKTGKWGCFKKGGEHFYTAPSVWEQAVVAFKKEYGVFQEEVPQTTEEGAVEAPKAPQAAEKPRRGRKPKNK